MTTGESTDDALPAAAAPRTVDAPFSVPYVHRLRFASDVLDPASPVLREVLGEPRGEPHRVLFVLDEGLCNARRDLLSHVHAWMTAHAEGVVSPVDPLVIAGGEQCKNNRDAVDAIHRAIDRGGICRQSFVITIGGGAVLDAAGYAAATAHRGVRLVRLPSTTLAQADSGVGVKCGINAFGKKNFIGAFAPPWAVINDECLLDSLSPRDWRSGFSEAVKVAVVKDRAFFEQIDAIADRLGQGRLDDAMLDRARPIIQRSAELHLRHITEGGDPFEMTEARPLDFGHWAAHMLEQVTDFELKHGEAVAIGMAIDIIYATLTGLLDREPADRLIRCLSRLGFTLHHEALADPATLLTGLQEFREHLGGPLTIAMLTGIGRAVDVHEIDPQAMRRAITTLQSRVTNAA